MRSCNFSLPKRAAHALFALAALFGVSSSSLAQSPVPSNAPTGFPAWWFERNVIAPTNSNYLTNIPNWPGDYPASDDYSAINQGTLKNLATAAIAELQAQLPATVLTNSNAVALQNLIAGWITNPATNADNYAAVNQGQLKYLAKQFYDVLGSGSYTAGLGLQPTNWASGTYPWSTNTGADPYSLANIGQAKYVFSFDLTAPSGQIPAWWAAYYGVSDSIPTAFSPAGDYYTLLQEYLLHRNPNDFYNGQHPNLTKISGDMQTGNPGGLVPAPLIVSVTDASNNPIANAPVVFSVQQGGGLLQTSSIGALATSVTARTANSGQAKAFFQLPNNSVSTSQIACTATSGTQSTTVSFSESSDNGSGSYTSPFAPSSFSTAVNPDGSMDVTWVNNADPNDTSAQVALQYYDLAGNLQTAATVPASLQSYHLPRQ